MQRFTGRAKEITNIPCKKHSICYKIWILADHGYVLLFMFHSKGDGKNDGPYKLDPQWQQKGLSATEGVVCHLAISIDPDLLKPNMHIIWLDNLFTKIRLLEELRRANIGAAGTVRPPANQTPREERLAIAQKKLEVKKKKAAKKEADKRDRELKKKEKETKTEANKRDREMKKEKEAAKQNKKDKRSTQQFTTAIDCIPLPEPISFDNAATLFEKLSESPLDFEELPDTNAPENALSLTDELDLTLVDDKFLDTETAEQEHDVEQKQEAVDNGNPETNEPFNDELVKLSYEH